MLERFNVFSIVSNAWLNFERDDTKRTDWCAIAAYILIPAALTYFSAIFFGGISSGSADGLLNACAIFGGLMFNLLVLCLDLSERAKLYPNKPKLLKLVTQLSYATQFSALECLVSVVLLAAIMRNEQSQVQAGWLAWVTFYILWHLLLTLLLILKRATVAMNTLSKPIKKRSCRVTSSVVKEATKPDQGEENLETTE